MNSEERDDLWELLGKAKTPTVSPFFSRNVLRAIREEQTERPGFLTWVSARWKVISIATAAVIVLAGLALRPEVQSQPDPLLALAGQVSASPDYQVISHLDELLDSEQNSIWLEASAY